MEIRVVMVASSFWGVEGEEGEGACGKKWVIVKVREVRETTLFFVEGGQSGEVDLSSIVALKPCFVDEEDQVILEFFGVG